METNTRPALPSHQVRLAHDLNPGGLIEPITVDGETAERTKPLTEACGTFRKLDTKAARAEANRGRDADRRALLIVAALWIVTCAAAFVGGVWACKAGGW